MDLGEPIRSVIPSLTGSVLAVLANAGEPLTGGEVHRRVKHAASNEGVQKALGALVAGGIVQRINKGRAGLYSLNRDHVASDAIVALASLRASLIERLRSALGAWTPTPVSATIFGSFARGQGGPESDIDLLLISPDADIADAWSSHVTDLIADVQRWTGNPLRPVILSASELPRQLARGEPYLEAAEREGLTLIGTPLRRLRSGGAE